MILLRRNAETWRVFATMALAAFLFTVIPVSSLVSSAWATPKEDLNQAIEFFDFADYQAALDLLDGVLAGGLATGDLLRDTHIYRARSFIGLNNDSAAQSAFCEALKVDNNWRPDGVFYSRDEIAVFDQSSAVCDLTIESEDDGDVAWYKKPVYLIAGGVVLLGSILVLGGGDDDPAPAPATLAGFPDPPPDAK